MNWDRILNILLIVVVVALVVTVFLGRRSGNSNEDVLRLQTELDTLRDVNRRLELQNQELSQSKTMLETGNELLEQSAREDLGYIKDGEIVVVLPK